VSHAPQAHSSTHHHPQALLGNNHPSSLKSLPRDTNMELVLYAYTHLIGLLFLLPLPSLAHTSALAVLQQHKRGPGGGGMDISIASPPPPRRHKRIARSLWGLIPSPASTGLSPSHRTCMPSYGGSPSSPTTCSLASAGAKLADHKTDGAGLGLGRVGLGLGGVQEGYGWITEQPMPVIEVTSHACS